MSSLSIPHHRLHNQQIANPTLHTPGELVAHLGAVQAQDYAGAKWAIGLRLPNATEADIEQAVTERTIVRTWPMRRTLHFVPAADIRWMLALTASRADAGFAPRYRQLELDERTLAAAGEVLGRALSGGKSISRPVLYQVLRDAGIDTSGLPVRPGAPPESAQARGLHILGHHAQKGLICYGVHEGKQPTFVLLDEWVPKSRALDREEALAELAKRYFTSHGPATIADFTWWSGLTVRDATAGVEMSRRDLVSDVSDGRTYWLPSSIPGESDSVPAVHMLPPFDEYTVAYKDRSAVIAPEYAGQASNGGIFRPIIVVDGQVVGTWKAVMSKGPVVVVPMPFGMLNRAEEAAFDQAARRYADFRAMSLSVA